VKSGVPLEVVPEWDLTRRCYVVNFHLERYFLENSLVEIMFRHIHLKAFLFITFIRFEKLLITIKA